jgi:ABC-type multidrug transport system ATPase subunit
MISAKEKMDLSDLSLFNDKNNKIGQNLSNEVLVNNTNSPCQSQSQQLLQTQQNANPNLSATYVFNSDFSPPSVLKFIPSIGSSGYSALTTTTFVWMAFFLVFLFGYFAVCIAVLTFLHAENDSKVGHFHRFVGGQVSQVSSWCGYLIFDSTLLTLGMVFGILIAQLLFAGTLISRGYKYNTFEFVTPFFLLLAETVPTAIGTISVIYTSVILSRSKFLFAILLILVYFLLIPTVSLPLQFIFPNFKIFKYIMYSSPSIHVGTLLSQCRYHMFRFADDNWCTNPLLDPQPIFYSLFQQIWTVKLFVLLFFTYRKFHTTDMSSYSDFSPATGALGNPWGWTARAITSTVASTSSQSLLSRMIKSEQNLRPLASNHIAVTSGGNKGAKPLLLTQNSMHSSSASASSLSGSSSTSPTNWINTNSVDSSAPQQPSVNPNVTLMKSKILANQCITGRAGGDKYAIVTYGLRKVYAQSMPAFQVILAVVISIIRLVFPQILLCCVQERARRAWVQKQRQDIMDQRNKEIERLEQEEMQRSVIYPGLWTHIDDTLLSICIEGHEHLLEQQIDQLQMQQYNNNLQTNNIMTVYDLTQSLAMFGSTNYGFDSGLSKSYGDNLYNSSATNNSTTSSYLAGKAFGDILQSSTNTNDDKPSNKQSKSNNKKVIDSDSDDDENDSDDEEEEDDDEEEEYSQTGSPTVAINNLYLAVKKNSVLCLCGANGAGKSTLLSVLTSETAASPSLDPYTISTVFIEDTNLVSHPGATHQRVGYCPQYDRINKELSAEQHFYLYAALCGYNPWDQKTIKFISELIDDLGLSSIANQPCGLYPPGQRRLVTIGIALLGNNDIVVLDEPTAFSDALSRTRIHSLLQRLIHSRTLVFTSHLVEDMDFLADEIAIMAKGGLQIVGSKSLLKDGKGVLFGNNNPTSNESNNSCPSVISNGYGLLSLSPSASSYNNSQLSPPSVSSQLSQSSSILIDGDNNNINSNFTAVNLTPLPILPPLPPSTFVFDKDNIQSSLQLLLNHTNTSTLTSSQVLAQQPLPSPATMTSTSARSSNSLVFTVQIYASTIESILFTQAYALSVLTQIPLPTFLTKMNSFVSSQTSGNQQTGQQPDVQPSTNNDVDVEEDTLAQSKTVIQPTHQQNNNISEKQLSQAPILTKSTADVENELIEWITFLKRCESVGIELIRAPNHPTTTMPSFGSIFFSSAHHISSPPPNNNNNQHSNISTNTLSGGNHGDENIWIESWNRMIQTSPQQFGNKKLHSVSTIPFTILINIDVIPLTNLFTILQACKNQTGGLITKYTAQQPTLNQLFVNVVDSSQ